VAEQSALRYGEGEGDGSEPQFLCFGSGCLMLSSGEMREAFDAVDTGGDGLISAAQLRAACEKLAEIGEGGAFEEDIDWMLEAVDRDHDGQIDFEEFVQALTIQREPA